MPLKYKKDRDRAMTQDEKFVIFWLYNAIARKMPDNPYGSNDILVNGINVTETVRKLLQDRLFV
jgi:hypothetical protein